MVCTWQEVCRRRKKIGIEHSEVWQMEIFDVFSMNGIENYDAAGEIFLENVILKVSQTHFSKDFYPKGGGPMPPPWLSQGGHKFFKGGNAPPRGGGGLWSTLGYALGFIHIYLIELCYE